MFRFTVILTKILRLKQFCNHPYAPLPAEQHHGLPPKSSTKMLKVLSIIEAIPPGEKVIIFSQFKNSLDLLAILLNENGYHNEHMMYHGRLTPQDKESTLQRFEQNPTKSILLMSIKAGGVGLNLVAANHVILLDPWWNRAVEEQALARVHRIGQTREVHIHRLAIRNSIEQWVLSLQEHKLREACKVLDDQLNNSTPSGHRNFTQEDLRRLFRENCY